MTRLEHANLTVPDIDAAIRFLQLIAPDFKVRRDARPAGSFRWAHVGNDDFYLALQEAHLDSIPKSPRTAYKNFGVNHLALVVDDVGAIEAKLMQAGYRRSVEAPQERFRKRVYFYDDSGFEWEFVEYFSKNPPEKFLYE